MANVKSAAKRARQEARRRGHNQRISATWRTLVRSVREAADKKDPGLDAAYQKAVSYLAHARSKGVLHKNNAARRISRLTKLVNTSKATAKA